MWHHVLHLCISLLLVASPVMAGGIYRWVDENGKIHLTDSPPEQVAAEPLEVEVNTYEAIDYSKIEYYKPPPKPVQRQVVMYSTRWCGFCARARQYFEQNRISYTEYDIETDNAAKLRYEAFNGRGVPVIFVGKKRMNGFSVKGFEQLYRAPAR